MHMLCYVHCMHVCCVLRDESICHPVSVSSDTPAVSLPCCRPLKASSATTFVSAQSTQLPSRCMIRSFRDFFGLSQFYDSGKCLLQLPGDRFERGGHKVVLPSNLLRVFVLGLAKISACGVAGIACKASL